MRPPALDQSLPILCLTKAQVAQQCQVGLDLVEQWANRRGFPMVREGKDGRIQRIPVRELQDWLAQNAITKGVGG